MIILDIILVAFCLLLALPFAIGTYDRLTGKHLLCDTFGWHNGNGGSQSFDGCSLHATCSKCRKEVMQDSQGNWF